MKNFLHVSILLLLVTGTAFAQSECDLWLGKWDITYDDGSTYVWDIDQIVTVNDANIKCQAFGTSAPNDEGEPFFIQIIYVVFSTNYVYSESQKAGQEMAKHVIVLNNAGDAFKSGTGFTDYHIAFGSKQGKAGPRCSLVSPSYVFQGSKHIVVTITGEDTAFNSASSRVIFDHPGISLHNFKVVSPEKIILTIDIAEDADPSECNITVITGNEQLICNFVVQESFHTERLVWTFETGGIIQSSPAVSNGFIYFGSNDNKVYCLNAETGQKVWEYETGADVSSSPLVAEGNLYIGSNDKKIYCLNAGNGKKKWDYTTDNAVASSAAIYNNKIYIGNFDKKIFCLNAETGKKIWQYQTIADIFSTPAVSEGRVFVGDVRNTLYCLDAELGTLLWTFKTKSDIPPSPAVSNGYVYFGSRDNNFYCVEVETGKKVWSYKTGNVVYSSPAVAGEYVYFGSLDHKLYSLNKKTGELNFAFYTNNVIHGSPAATGKYVYIGSGDTYIYCIDAASGNKIWSSKTGGIVASSPAIADGKIYFGSFDKKLYCLKAGDNDQGLWPMFRYNNHRTGKHE